MKTNITNITKLAVIFSLVFFLVSCAKKEKIDFSKASFETVKKYAEQNNEQAQCELGIRYFLGENVEKNYKEAYKWFSIAKANNSGGVIGNMVGDEISKYLMSLEQKMSSGQIQQAQDLALKWQKDFEARKNQKQEYGI